MEETFQICLEGTIDRNNFNYLYLHPSTVTHPYDEYFEYYNIRKTIIDGKPCTIELTNPAEPEWFDTHFHSEWYNMDGFILIYHISSLPSFEQVKETRRDIIRREDLAHCSFVLVGTGIDQESTRQISTLEGAELARSWGCPFFESSCELLINVYEPFEALVQEIRKVRLQAATSSISISASTSTSTPTKKKSALVTNSISKAFQKLLKPKVTASQVSSPLWKYTMNDDLEGIQAKVAFYGKRVIDSEKNVRGSTALMIASENGFLSIVQYLISTGANIHLEDNFGATALQLASIQGHLPIVQLLISSGANPESTALIWASGQNHLSVVEYLIKSGADINGKDKNGNAALHWAAQAGNVTTVQYLVSVSGIDINNKSSNGSTALIIASKEGHLSVIKCLLSNGASVDQIISLKKN